VKLKELTYKVRGVVFEVYYKLCLSLLEHNSIITLAY